MKLDVTSIPPGAALWTLAAVVALGGGIGVIQTLEPQIALERANRYDAERNLENDRAVLARSDAVVTQRTRDRALLHGIDVDDDGATIVARFLSELARLAAATRVSVTQLGSAEKGAANSAAPPPVVSLNGAVPTHSAAPHTAAFSATKLGLKLEGRYSDLLSAMRAFSTIGVLAELDVAALERARGDRLTASLNVILYRRATPSPLPADALRRKTRSDATLGPT